MIPEVKKKEKSKIDIHSTFLNKTLKGMYNMYWLMILKDNFYKKKFRF